MGKGGLSRLIPKSLTESKLISSTNIGNTQKKIFLLVLFIVMSQQKKWIINKNLLYSPGTLLNAMWKPGWEGSSGEEWIYV